MITVKPKKCKVCKVSFTPRSSFQAVCSPICAVLLVKHKPEEAAKSEKAATRKWLKDKKESAMTRSEWMNLCQKVFNTYIRMRDAGKPCISSGRPLTGKFDAGHFYTTGSYPNLRFHEDNVHGQSVHDNRDKHGNLNEYRPRLIERIGQERFDALEAQKNDTLKLTIPEIQEMIALYRKKIKEITP